jgi:hypothetical protein
MELLSLLVAWLAKHRLAATLVSLGLGGLAFVNFNLLNFTLPPNFALSGETCGPAVPQYEGLGGTCPEGQIRAKSDVFSYKTCDEYARKLGRAKKQSSRLSQNETPFEFRYWTDSHQTGLIHYTYSYCPVGDVH